MSSTVKESELAVREREYQYVYDYLDKYMSYEYKESYNFQPNGKVKENRTIWICWFQGLDKAPLLVKKCVDSVMRNKPEDFSVILVNWINFSRKGCKWEYLFDTFLRYYQNRDALSVWWVLDRCDCLLQ